MIGNITKLDFSNLDQKIKKVIVSLKRIVTKLLFPVIFQVRKRLYNMMGEWFCFVENLLFSYSAIFAYNTESSNHLSKILRPWFEHQRIRGVFGFTLILSLLIFGIFGTSVSSSSNSVFASFSSNIDIDNSEEAEISVVETPKEAVVITEKRFQMPVALISASQGFQNYHPGVDLRAEYGSPIKPIADGVVSDVYRSKYGYGQSIYINHAEGYSSLYAHVQRIAVEAGSGVDEKTIIAEVGLTGYTTGPHLHLEIYKEEKAVNPKYFLDY